MKVLKILLLSTLLSANLFADSVDEAVEVLENMESDAIQLFDVEGDYEYEEDMMPLSSASASGNSPIDLVSMVEWYETPHSPFRFHLYNLLPHKLLYISAVRCAYEYVNMLGEPLPIGGSAGSFSTFPGAALLLDADKVECVRKFNCMYTVTVKDRPNSFRNFTIGLDLKKYIWGKDACLVSATAKVKGGS